jgi:hypothetical protein
MGDGIVGLVAKVLSKLQGIEVGEGAVEGTVDEHVKVSGA